MTISDEKGEHFLDKKIKLATPTVLDMFPGMTREEFRDLLRQEWKKFLAESSPASLLTADSQLVASGIVGLTNLETSLPIVGTFVPVPLRFELLPLSTIKILQVADTKVPIANVRQSGSAPVAWPQIVFDVLE